MKKKLSKLALVAIIIGLIPVAASAQQVENQNLVNVTRLKTKWPEKGSGVIRDSLIQIYNDNVIKKNEKILSHREYSHFFTTDNKDYMILEEFKDFSSMEEAWKINTDLEKKAWPDEKKRKEFMDAMGAYFDDWHGDAIFHTNPKLSKN